MFTSILHQHNSLSAGLKCCLMLQYVPNTFCQVNIYRYSLLGEQVAELCRDPVKKIHYLHHTM